MSTQNAALKSHLLAHSSITLESYMREVISNLQNPNILSSLVYSESDKDCGYRSGLKYLGLQRTSETDTIANRVIYGNLISIKSQEQKSGQLELFA